MDYTFLDKRCIIYKEELIQITMHPNKILRYIENGYNIEEIFEFKKLQIELHPEPLMKQFKKNKFTQIEYLNDKTKIPEGNFEKIIVENYKFQIWTLKSRK